MLVVDDSLLLLVLAGVGGTQITEAVLAIEVFTTGSWYWRLARAIRDPRSTGALTRAFAALEAPEQDAVRSALGELPGNIGLIGARDLVPVMTSLHTPRRLNLLAAEALATAILLDATIAVTTESDLLSEACSALGVPIRHDLS